MRQERHTQGVEFGAKPSRSAEAADAELLKTPREESSQLPRGFRIIEAHLEKFGYTPDCLGCEAGLRADNPETPALVWRDERHIKCAEADAQKAGPEARDASPRRGGRDTEVEIDEDQASEFATPVLDDSDDDISIDEQSPAPAERGSAVRQREPLVDEDGLPLDDVEDSALKRRRLGQLCARSLLTEMTEMRSSTNSQ